MIQRKQTVFLFLALLTTIACLCLPVGSFEPKGMGAESILMNLWISDANGGKDFNVWALFAILLVTCPINLFAIFDYHNRKRQARFCTFSMLMIIGWYVVYGVFSQVLMTGFDFHIKSKRTARKTAISKAIRWRQRNLFRRVLQAGCLIRVRCKR